MAFPVVAATNNGTEGINTTSHTVNLPTGISSGHLLLVSISFDGDVTTTWPTDWIKILDDSNAGGTQTTFTIAYKIATGSEGSTISVTSSGSEQSAHASYRITGWHGTTPPELTGSGTNNANPDPPSESASWGTEDNLWIVATGWNDGTTSVSSYPTNYSSNQVTANNGSPGGCGVAVASRELATTTEDPGTFTISAGEVHSVATIVVRPAGGTIITVTDSGAGADSVSQVQVSLGVVDSGAGADSLPGTAVATQLQESGSGVDQVAVMIQIILQESGAGSDQVISPEVQAMVQESGSGVDQVSQIQVSVIVVESGTGVDLVSVITGAIVKSVTDSGSGVDLVSIQVTTQVQESGSGVDQVDQIQVATQIQDSGAGSDQVTVQAQVTIQDVGSGLDAVSVIIAGILKTITDSGSGVDQVSIQAQVTIQDVASVVEAILARAAVVVQESGTALEIVTSFDVSVNIVTISIVARQMRIQIRSRKHDMEIQARPYQIHIHKLEADQ